MDAIDRIDRQLDTLFDLVRALRAELAPPPRRLPLRLVDPPRSVYACSPCECGGHPACARCSGDERAS